MDALKNERIDEIGLAAQKTTEPSSACPEPDPKV